MAITYLTRRAVFSASHRLHSPALSDVENAKLFGKCNRANGHGHNYVLEVTLRGELDPKTGILFDLQQFKGILAKEVLDRVDHTHLNHDVEEFLNINPTVENIAKVIWQWLVVKLPSGLLYEVRVHETENNVAFYRGE